MRTNTALQIIFAFFLGLVVVAFVGIGVNTFYPEPAYVDGRPDELVRGVELIGTPLTSFSKILAMSDQREVFNGTCGAESGGVPVSSVAPELLTAQIEVQKKEKSTERPPVLPAPKMGRPQ